MPSLILTTCGTSLLTNGADSKLRDLLNQYANASLWSDFPSDIATLLQSHIEQQKNKLFNADIDQVRKLSAELNALITWEQKQQKNPQNMHLLVSTDTVLGKATAEMIFQWLQHQKHQVFEVSERKLNTKKLHGFREALSGLTKQLVNHLDDYKAKGYSIHFNLNGGFKSLNGFLQALSTIYADESFYLFEKSTDLMLIPKLPFTLDAKKTILKNFAMYRRLANKLPVSIHDCAGIPDILLFKIDNDALLSEWGELLWQMCYKKLYQEKLLPSVSKKVIFSSNFELTTKKLNAHILQILNERIVDLATLTESQFEINLDSLRAKPLQEKKYKDVNLWECNLDPHHRIFMKKNGHVLTLEKVDASLH